MRTLTKYEQANRTLTADAGGKTVEVVHTVRPDQDDPNRYELVWRFNFENVTPAELLKLATKTILIICQRDWRKAKNRMDENVWDNRTFNVRDVLDEARKTADPAQRARSAASKLGREDKMALLKQLQEELKG